MDIRAQWGKHALNDYTLLYPYSEVEDLGGGYDFFKNEYGRILKYRMDKRKNHALFICGESQSGKTTTMLSLCKKELVRGTKIIYGNIKDERVPLDGDRRDIMKCYIHKDEAHYEDVTNIARIFGVEKSKAMPFKSALKMLHTKNIDVPTLKRGLVDQWYDRRRGLKYDTLFDKSNCLILDGRKDPERFGVIFSNVCRQVLMKRRAGAERYRLLIAIDEAGDPSYGVVHRRAPSEIKSSIAGLAMQGAILNVLMVFNTQYPADLQPSVILNCPHRIFHAMWYSTATDRVAKSLGLSPTYIAKVLPNLAKGECLFSARNTLEKRYVIRA
jgi:hypothetical protein